MMRAAAVGALTLMAACAPRAATADPQSCAPSTASLAPGATASALEGPYRVRLVATSGPHDSGTTDGTLSLGPAPASSGAAKSRHILVGNGDLRLEEVGGPALDVASTDPTRPGVMGFDLPPLANTNAPRVMLRLGAEANRQDVARIEGPYTVLRLRELREDGFAGDWTSGAPLPVAEGFFCAWKAAEQG